MQNDPNFFIPNGQFINPNYGAPGHPPLGAIMAMQAQIAMQAQAYAEMTRREAELQIFLLLLLS